MLWKSHCLNTLKSLWHIFYVFQQWMNSTSCSCSPELLPSTPRHQPNEARLDGSTAEIGLFSCLVEPIILEANPPVLQRHQVDHWPTFRAHVWLESKTEEWVVGIKIFKAKALAGYCGLNVEHLHRLTHLNTLFPVGPLFLEHCRTFRKWNLAEGIRTWASDLEVL